MRSLRGQRRRPLREGEFDGGGVGFKVGAEGGRRFAISVAVIVGVIVIIAIVNVVVGRRVVGLFSLFFVKGSLDIKERGETVNQRPEIGDQAEEGVD